MNKHYACDVILLNFTRAFDKVLHCIIKQKLANLGIVTQPLDWITYFHSERTQVVPRGGAASAPVPVTSGVIQGLIVGPLLFDAFISNMPEQVTTCDVILYTVDAKVYWGIC